MNKTTALSLTYRTPRGQPDGWSPLLDHHDRWLRTVVASRVGERQAVDEVMQNVSLALCSSPVRPAQVANPTGWLYRLAVRQALLYRRACGRRNKLTDRYAARVRDGSETGAPDPLAWLLIDERDALVREAMTQVPPRDREILLLKYTEGWSCRDLATHLNQSEPAIVARLHRARARLRLILVRMNVVEVQP